MESFLNSFLLIAVSEMGDKTQLLAILLAARFQRPWCILAGILSATLLNHWLASYFGMLVGSRIDPEILRWVLIVLFLGFGLWILVPDKKEKLEAPGKMGAFLTTAFLFFIAEMGDKTQFATIALAANYQDVLSVTAGSTLGMMLTNAIGVFGGAQLLKRIDLKWIRRIASALFILFAVGILFRVI